MAKTQIVEIFSSIQGEGQLLGTPMIFVRFGGCNLRCRWCDEPDTLAINSGREQNLEMVIETIKRLSKNAGISWVSLTGGEPLLRIPFLLELTPRLKALGLKIYLETSGIFHEALERVNPSIDIISMDIKLPSAFSNKDSALMIQSHLDPHELLARHERFLALSSEKTLVKIVITKDTQTNELLEAFNVVKKFPKIILTVLQLVTPRNNVLAPTPDQLQHFYQLAWKILPQPIRLMPQYHPYWKLP